MKVDGFKGGGEVTNQNFRGGNINFSPKVGGFKGGGEVKPIYNFLSPITGFVGGGSVTTSNTSTNISPLNVSNFRYEGGGSITSDSGQTITGMGPDTQLIWLNQVRL